MSRTPQTVQLHQKDNVRVALSSVPAGHSVNGDLQTAEPIPSGHKVAVRSIAAGEPVMKYGLPIGTAITDISPGHHVHSHNLATALGEQEYPGWSETGSGPDTKSPSHSFEGYQRSNGRAAIRNEIWIVNTVACVNQTAMRLAERGNREIVPGNPSLDGVHAFPHPFGCSQLGDDLSSTQKILAGLINHPHAAGVLILGLGCENNRMVEQLKSVDGQKMEHVRYFNTQEVPDENEEGMRHLVELAADIAKTSRRTLPSSQLVLGMKCGGSDGFSGITANPLLGRISDLHCAAGGTVLLTEVPEMFGAESVLLSRCASPGIHAEVVTMIEEFKNYFRSHDQPISENPSPGNVDGGITTLEEKSLGCVQKGGVQALIKQVVPYGEQAASGLGGIALVNGPGNDGVSTTALTTAGANLVLFTTGRGTPLGAPVPTIKVATNSTLAENKPAWIDFDAGRLTAGADFEQLADELYQLILEMGSGTKQAKNEINGYREIAIWKTGVTL